MGPEHVPSGVARRGCVACLGSHRESDAASPPWIVTLSASKGDLWGMSREPSVGLGHPPTQGAPKGRSEAEETVPCADR